MLADALWNEMEIITSFTNAQMEMSSKIIETTNLDNNLKINQFEFDATIDDQRMA